MKTLARASITLCSLALLAAAGLGADPVAELWKNAWGEDAKVHLKISREGDPNNVAITSICVGDKPKLTATIDPPAGGYDSANLSIWKDGITSSIASGTSSPLEKVYEGSLGVGDHTFTAKATIHKAGKHSRSLTPEPKTLSVVDNGTLTVKDKTYNRSQEDDNIDPPPAAPTAQPLIVGPRSLGPEADQKGKITLSFTFPVQTWTTDTFPWSLVGMSMSGQFSRGEGGSSQVSVEDLAPSATYSVLLGKTGNGVYARRIDIELPQVDVTARESGAAGPISEADEEDVGAWMSTSAAVTLTAKAAGIDGYARELSWTNASKVIVKDQNDVTQSSPISLAESDGDKTYTVTPTAEFTADESAKLTLEVSKDGTTFKDKVTLSKREVNFVVDSVGEEEEETEGAYIGVNDNFDEGNVDASDDPVPDNQPNHENGADRHRITASDSDLKIAKLKIVGGTATGTWKLTWTNASKIKVWQSGVEIVNGTDSGEVTLPETIEFKIEGMAPSSSLRDVEMTATFTPADQSPSGEDLVAITVVDVSITKPKGSLDGKPDGGNSSNPPQSWIGAAPYRFDFQGVISTSPNTYNLDIQGDVSPMGRKWTLESSAGTLANDTEVSPTHTAPATPGEGILRLKAMDGTTATSVSKSRRVKIYQDHLARDRDNFGVNISGGSPDTPAWSFTKYGVTVNMPNYWNCHGGTWHLFNGTGTGSSNSIPAWEKVAEEILPLTPAKLGRIQAACQRGYIVVYYVNTGQLAHSQTVLSGTITYGANNVPVSAVNGGMPGVDEAWKWAESEAGRWADNVNAQYQPVVVKVFKRP